MKYSGEKNNTQGQTPQKPKITKKTQLTKKTVLSPNNAENKGVKKNINIRGQKDTKIEFSDKNPLTDNNQKDNSALFLIKTIVKAYYLSTWKKKVRAMKYFSRSYNPQRVNFKKLINEISLVMKQHKFNYFNELCGNIDSLPMPKNVVHDKNFGTIRIVDKEFLSKKNTNNTNKNTNKISLWAENIYNKKINGLKYYLIEAFKKMKNNREMSAKNNEKKNPVQQPTNKQNQNQNQSSIKKKIGKVKDYMNQFNYNKENTNNNAINTNNTNNKTTVQPKVNVNNVRPNRNAQNYKNYYINNNNTQNVYRQKVDDDENYIDQQYYDNNIQADEYNYIDDDAYNQGREQENYVIYEYVDENNDNDNNNNYIENDNIIYVDENNVPIDNNYIVENEYVDDNNYNDEMNYNVNDYGENNYVEVANNDNNYNDNNYYVENQDNYGNEYVEYVEGDYDDNDNNQYVYVDDNNSGYDYYYVDNNYDDNNQYNDDEVYYYYEEPKPKNEARNVAYYVPYNTQKKNNVNTYNQTRANNNIVQNRYYNTKSANTNTNIKFTNTTGTNNVSKYYNNARANTSCGYNNNMGGNTTTKYVNKNTGSNTSFKYVNSNKSNNAVAKYFKKPEANTTSNFVNYKMQAQARKKAGSSGFVNYSNPTPNKYGNYSLYVSKK